MSDVHAQNKSFSITLGGLMRWLLGPMIAIALFGILPTWLISQWDGVYSEIAAVLAVLAVMFLTGSLTVSMARRGISAAATTFLGCALLRLLLCPALVALLYWITDLPPWPMVVWMIITYTLCLGLEVVWMIRALRQAAPDMPRKKSETEKPTGPANWEI